MQVKRFTPLNYPHSLFILQGLLVIWLSYATVYSFLWDLGILGQMGSIANSDFLYWVYSRNYWVFKYRDSSYSSVAAVQLLFLPNKNSLTLLPFVVLVFTWLCPRSSMLLPEYRECLFGRLKCMSFNTGMGERVHMSKYKTFPCRFVHMYEGVEFVQWLFRR